MKVTEVLAELFDKQAIPLAWKKSNGVTMAFGELAHSDPNDQRDLDIRFFDKGNGIVELEFSIDNKFSVTGRGNANVVFATVIQAVKQFVSEHPNVHTIIFSASELSRARMYDTLAKRISREVGWHIVPHEEVVKNPQFSDLGGFGFVIQKGQAPAHRQAAQKTQHEKFKPVWYVYSLEDPNAPVVKVTGGKGYEAETFVHRTVPEYKNLDTMGTFSGHAPPSGKTNIIDAGEIKLPPKPQPRQMNSLEKALHDKLNGPAR
jgi:hypothetical protein